MKLTTKGRYAVTAMLDLSLHNAEGPVSLADISKREDISLSYLEQLFSKLRKRGHSKCQLSADSLKEGLNFRGLKLQKS